MRVLVLLVVVYGTNIVCNDFVNSPLKNIYMPKNIFHQHLKQMQYHRWSHKELQHV